MDWNLATQTCFLGHLAGYATVENWCYSSIVFKHIDSKGKESCQVIPPIIIKEVNDSVCNAVNNT